MANRHCMVTIGSGNYAHFRPTSKDQKFMDKRDEILNLLKSIPSEFINHIKNQTNDGGPEFNKAVRDWNGLIQKYAIDIIKITGQTN